ncbi:MAG: hypothetical protein ACI9SJ_002139 [Flavobacteriaceae bacterium]|jgi:hypothetical protein|uniref:DUF6122 family protein n=1 Tax=Candidatus Marifrigoribacter sp. Uisw_064 TaxID=3230970 RepID=UPI003ADCCFC4
MLQTITHYSLHLLVPGIIAYLFFRSNWKRAWLIMLATMLIDLDHLLADPIFSATRCSINFHPLHSYWAIAVYVLLAYFKKSRIIAVGLVLHIITDSIDCLWMR